MNVCGNSMRKLLARLRVYDPQSPQLAAEIGAYEAGLGAVLDAIGQAADEAFIQTASIEGLNQRELLFRPVASDSGVDEKRDLLLERSALRGCFVPDMEKRLRAAGIRGGLIENHLGGIAVNVDSFIGVTPEEAQRDAEALMPAHLAVHLDYTGRRWDAKDLRDLDFDDADALDETWDEADALN